MSFRELRNLTEIMRALDYPHVVSIDDFRNPNFELVAEMLYWMAKQYDPGISISDNIENGKERVGFLNAIAQALLSRAHLQLNTKHLYAANGIAVKELLKLATVLYKAQRAADDIVAKNHCIDYPMQSTTQLRDVNEATQLAKGITECGTHLCGLLDNEEIMHSQRNNALNFVDTVLRSSTTSGHQFIEMSLHEVNETMKEGINNMVRQTEDIEADIEVILPKIKKKQGELARLQKQSKALQNHRPAFSGELERLEADLQVSHETYLERLRNRDYLEYELRRYREIEQKEIQEHERQCNRKAERVRKDELKQFIGHEAGSDATVEEEFTRRIGRSNVDGNFRRKDSHTYPSSTGQEQGYQVKNSLQVQAGRTEETSWRNSQTSDMSSIEDEISLNDLTARSLTIDDEGSQVRSHSSCSGSDAF